MTENRSIKGILIPIGGNEDKGTTGKSRANFLEKGILSHILQEAKGKGSKVVVIPIASNIPDEVGENYIKAFGKLGCKDISVLRITRRGQSDGKEVLRLIGQADCIMFSGGNQSRISHKIKDTAFHRILLQRFEDEPLVIAGTSAGAMAMATEMIAGGSSSEALQKGAVKMKKGLGLIPGLIIDTHFVRRGRFGRLAEALAKYPDKVGVGLAEDTGLIIKNRNEFRVIGSGMVIVMDPANLTHNSYQQLQAGTPMSMSNLTTHILANGDRFNLDNREIEVLPIAASFV
ncbi:MAG TPA: cyanophycinase [Cyclobacteriaceae bacterium]|nr:cyanophycinase [Cyclobacteriaceae bacterium]MCB9238463.1 cyanophycinase [Flammeovirgaceae bacterium]MCB0500514.1 cyanophycinase [Cyclobacteriaceae bacterium]MCO5271410.1 cyanophycinase [Cyclobacteriaceae bacterium]MCW5903589.1 cyanophycinase [Cyclobacteriaceae bacterium]